MTETTIQYQEPKELKNELKELADIVPDIVTSIVDREIFEIASNEKAKWDDIEKRWVAYWKDAKESANRTHKLIKGMENEGLLIIEANRPRLLKIISDYLLKEKEEREAEERRINLENIAIKEAKEKALREAADKALNEGKLEVAEALEEQANLTFVEPTLPSTQISTKIALEGGGTQSAKEDWDISVIDERAFARAALANEQRIPWQAISVTPQLSQLKMWIRAEKIKSFPGLEIKPKMGITTRSWRK